MGGGGGAEVINNNTRSDYSTLMQAKLLKSGNRLIWFIAQRHKSVKKLTYYFGLGIEKNISNPNI